MNLIFYLYRMDNVSITSFFNYDFLLKVKILSKEDFSCSPPRWKFGKLVIGKIHYRVKYSMKVLDERRWFLVYKISSISVLDSKKIFWIYLKEIWLSELSYVQCIV